MLVNTRIGSRPGSWLGLPSLNAGGVGMASRATVAALGRALTIAGNLIDAVVFEWPTRRRQRRHLASLDDRMLRDIGLSRADAEREAGKRPWRE